MIEITKEEIEAISRSLKAGDYQFRKPKTIEKLIANHRASQCIRQSLNNAYDHIQHEDYNDALSSILEAMASLPEPPTNKGGE